MLQRKKPPGYPGGFQDQTISSLLRHHGGGRWCWGRNNRWCRHGSCHRGLGNRATTAAGRGGGCCTGITRVQPGELGLQPAEQADFARIGTGRGEPGEDRSADERSAASLRFADRGTGNHWCGALAGTSRVAEVGLQAGQLGLDLGEQTQARAAGIVAGGHRLARGEARCRDARRTAASAVRATHYDGGIGAQGHGRSQQQDRCIHREFSRVIVVVNRVAWDVGRCMAGCDVTASVWDG